MDQEYQKSRSRPSIPVGLRDILPAEAKKRRRLEGCLRDCFEARGYGEVICPTFEFYDLLSVETGSAVTRDMVRFLGSDGRLLALRPEMTTTIARVVAQRLDTTVGPHRLYYIANVFREEFAKGRTHEFWQAGVEMVGSGNMADDVEIISLFIETLNSVGLPDFQISLGQIDFLNAAIDTLALARDDGDRLRSALTERSLVAYKQTIAGLPLKAEVAEGLLSLPSLRGGIEVFQAAAALGFGSKAQTALQRLRDVYKRLSEAGLTDRIVIDLGVWRDFDYYTGLVFEAYAPGLGVPIGGGGRYDNLLTEFGCPAPAAGFALGLERLELAKAEVQL